MNHNEFSDEEVLIRRACMARFAADSFGHPLMFPQYLERFYDLDDIAKARGLIKPDQLVGGEPLAADVGTGTLTLRFAERGEKVFTFAAVLPATATYSAVNPTPAIPPSEF